MAGDPSLIAPPQLLRGAHHPSSLQLRRRSLAIAAKSPTPRNRSNSGRWGTLPPPVERFNGSISEGAGVSRDNRFQNSKILDSSIFGFSPRISSPPCQRRRFVRVKARGCECFDLHQELVPYGRAWDWQKRIVEKKKALAERNEEFSDSLIVLQHLPIYTMGTGSDSKHLNFDVADAPFEIHRTERGGEVTYHGPGQLVMYPILNLRKHKMDLHWYLRALEEVVIRSLSTTFSIQASRVDGLTGVWVGDRKLAAIGIKVSQWITFHGLALNVTADLTPFNWITPCGIKDRRVGSIKQLLGESRLSDEHQDAARGSDDLQLINVLYESLVKEFCEVFQLEIHQQHMSEELTLLTRS